eukprot:COSAG05_NODE_19985_length_284_cov_1.383784_1_plen_45_part_01
MLSAVAAVGRWLAYAVAAALLLLIAAIKLAERKHRRAAASLRLPG